MAVLAVASVLVSTPSTASSSVAEPSGASQIVPLGHDHRGDKVSGLGEGRHQVRPDRTSTAVLSAEGEARGLPEAFGHLGSIITSGLRKLLRLFRKGTPRIRKDAATLKNKAKFKHEVAGIKTDSVMKRWKVALKRWKLKG